MLIPLINPRRSKRRNPIVFKAGQEDLAVAFKKYAKRQITHGSMKMKKSTKTPDYKFSYSGPWVSATGKVLSNSKKRPATSRGFSSSKQEGSMVYTLKRRPRRKARRARKNPWHIVRAGTGFRKVHTGRKARRHSRKRHAIRLGAHRPLLVRSHSGWRRPKRSRLFPRATRINPGRRSHRRYRRNPIRLPFNLMGVAMGGLKLAGGIALGFYGFPVIGMVMPKNTAGAPMLDRKYWGALHVVIGAVAASMIKKEIVRTMALTMAGVGVYDLLASNIPQLGLPQVNATLPGFNAAGDEQPGVIGMEADFAPALGSSYQAMGASYGRDDIAYGDDNDSLDC